jgi:hypothetical protein
VRISLIRCLARTCGCRLEPEFGDAGCDELLINLAAGFRVEVPGFRNDGFRDSFTQLPSRELAVGVGQLEPPRPRSIEPPGRDHR